MEDNHESSKSIINNPSMKRPLDETEVMPITLEGEMPQKRYYRSRAHCNPLSHNDSFEYPLTPLDMDWTKHYPSSNDCKELNLYPTVLDVGCGFGGLTVALAKLLPQERILGMEIRAKVTEYVRLRIVALRKEHPGQYLNASVLRTNSMKYLPNFCPPSSLSKIFFCFPDPQFKRKNWGRRIISDRLLTEYAYFIRDGGRLYCITDVLELHNWHVAKCDAHPLWERVCQVDGDGETVSTDPCVTVMQTATEESQKVDRSGAPKYYAVYQRIPNNQVRAPQSALEFFSTSTLEDEIDTVVEQSTKKVK
jgi:tRNA (guanine-N7-)-methyltransferase